jgi:uncharacterized ferritin-like protein (DUF455 family)
MDNIFDAAKNCIDEQDPCHKAELLSTMMTRWFAGDLAAEDSEPAISIPVPGRPTLPAMVDYIGTPARHLGQKQGKGAFIHAITHIEFNAINLALDAIYRFRQMPLDYYSDWLKIAVEEARHFFLLSDRLNDLGFQYGDFDAHNGLWEMALLTEHSLMERMALVPRLLEARGLDVAPKMIHRLKSLGDTKTVAILALILREEIGHVSTGTQWYNYACAQQDLDPESTFVALLSRFNKLPLSGPLNQEARITAGFSKNELDNLSVTSKQ